MRLIAEFSPAPLMVRGNGERKWVVGIYPVKELRIPFMFLAQPLAMQSHNISYSRD